MQVPGQLYVAMSRVRSPDDVFIFGINADDIQRRFELHMNCAAIQIPSEL